ncbi:MAG: DUF72 domain-containing protein [Deltaproteobacteria bacterium]|nr:DUF72 domain-containing protein [Deltaproteobacteria bacterium]
MPRIHIGRRSVQGKLESYAQRFDLVEVRPDPEAPVRASALKKWRESVPAPFVFSVVLPAAVTQARNAAAANSALEHALDVARVLQSPVILISPPAAFTPTASNRRKLGELVAKLPNDVVRLAWEPAGLWEPDEARVIAASLKITLVGDAAQDPLAPGSVAYTRLRGLGDARRMSDTRLDRVIENLRGRRESYVVIETDRPVSVAKAVREGLMEGDGGRARAPRPRASAQPLLAEDEEQE